MESSHRAATSTTPGRCRATRWRSPPDWPRCAGWTTGLQPAGDADRKAGLRTRRSRRPGTGHGQRGDRPGHSFLRRGCGAGLRAVPGRDRDVYAAFCRGCSSAGSTLRPPGSRRGSSRWLTTKRRSTRPSQQLPGRRWRRSGRCRWGDEPSARRHSPATGRGRGRPAERGSVSRALAARPVLGTVRRRRSPDRRRPRQLRLRGRIGTGGLPLPPRPIPSAGILRPGPASSGWRPVLRDRDREAGELDDPESVATPVGVDPGIGRAPCRRSGRLRGRPVAGSAIGSGIRF